MTEPTNEYTKYDYTIAIITSGNKETVIGGTEKIVEKTLKRKKGLLLDKKDIDVFYREMPLGTLAVDILQNQFGAEKVLPHLKTLYANLKSRDTNKNKVRATLMSLDTLYETEESYTVRILAKVLKKWYGNASNWYMSGYKKGGFQSGLALSWEKRAALGEKFYADGIALMENIYTSLKRKKSPREAENGDTVIKRPTTDISELIDEYSSFLAARKIYFLNCKNCRDFFIATACNTQYCDECKELGKKKAQITYAAKQEKDNLRKQKQNIRERFERFIYGRTKLSKLVSDSEREEYKQLYKDFMRITQKGLKEHEKNPNNSYLTAQIKQDLNNYDSKREKLEEKFKKKYMPEDMGK